MFFETFFGSDAVALLRRTRRRGSDRISTELLEILHRERSRADRTESEFCLIQFFSTGIPASPLVLEKIETLVRARPRVTDYVGRRPDGGTWLVLVDCSAEWAEILARDVLAHQPELSKAVRWSVHHYPTDRSIADVASRVGNPPQTGAAPESTAERQTSRAAGSIEPMEPLFELATPLWKRAADVAAAALGLLLLSPFFAAAALLARSGSPGPAFFQQLRAGRLGRPFTLYKFRTMLADAELRKQELLAQNEQDGPAFKMERDPRITRTGRWLRGLSLDELPQLWNVLVGDMSLVGPRPLPVEEAGGCLQWQRRRMDGTPGLTCYWQVKDRRNKISFADWARLDIRYLRERSPWLDLKLLFKTLWVVVRRKGI